VSVHSVDGMEVISSGREVESVEMPFQTIENDRKKFPGLCMHTPAVSTIPDVQYIITSSCIQWYLHLYW